MTESHLYTTTTDWNANRSIVSSAGFFAPHLRPGMTLLDCGCGPGSITVDFAEALAPAEVVGIDSYADVLDRGRATAAERGVTNVRFEQGDIYALQFSDATFDAVWTSSISSGLPTRAGRCARSFAS